MPQSQHDSHAIFVLPSAHDPAALGKGNRRWLSRGKLSIATDPVDPMEELLLLMDIDVPESGQAALRIWGQTGERPSGWIAAADPVSLEARLTHVVLHKIDAGDLPPDELGVLVEFLQRTLGDGGPIGFARIREYVYLRSKVALASASRSADYVDGQAPDALMPSGDDSASHHRLLSEIQMSLHDHETNKRRESHGLLPVNSLWIWGGGHAPEPTLQPLPPLYSDDPFLSGLWRSRLGVTSGWSEDFDEMFEASIAGFVAVAPVSGTVSSYVSRLRELHADRKPGRLTLLFRNGLRVELRARDRYRFWRGISSIFAGTGNE